MLLELRRCLRILSVRSALYVISSLFWLVLIHVELRNCHVGLYIYAIDSNKFVDTVYIDFSKRLILYHTANYCI